MLWVWLVSITTDGFFVDHFSHSLLKVKQKRPASREHYSFEQRESVIKLEKL